MPKFIRRETIRNAKRIFITPSGKALGVVLIDGKTKFYPCISYNLSICASENATIQGMVRN